MWPSSRARYVLSRGQNLTDGHIRALEPEPAGDDEDEGTIKPLPDRLVTELTAHRTLALRDALANNPDVAMTALLHKLCRATFFHHPFEGCLEVAVTDVGFAVQGPDLKISAPAKAIKDRQDAWKAALPADDDTLWTDLTALDAASRAALLAHCVSYGVNALYEPVKYPGGRVSEHDVRKRLGGADRLARAVGLDMVEAGWRPTVDNYLARVTKPRILEAVREAKGEASAQLIDHLKKGDMAREAERLLAGTGLAARVALRLADDVMVAEGVVRVLPDFLDGDDGDADGDENEPLLAAAE